MEVLDKEKTTVLFITHDIDEAIFLSQRIVGMAAGPGRTLKEFTGYFACLTYAGKCASTPTS